MKISNKSGNATVVVTLLIIVVILLCLVFIPKAKIEAPTITATSTPTVSVVATEQSIEQPSYTIDAEVPKVSGLSDVVVEKKINDTLAKKVKEIIDGFSSQAVNTKVSDGPGTKSSLEIKMESWATSKGAVLTVRLGVLTYFSGSAHPISFSEPSNFDLKTGNDLELIDVFDNSNVKYLSVISEYSIKALKEQLAKLQNVSVASPDLQFFEEGASSNPENFGAFLIEDSGIRFVFGQYQVAPYVFGEQEVLIPYSVIGQYLKKGEVTDALVK